MITNNQTIFYGLPKVH